MKFIMLLSWFVTLQPLIILYHALLANFKKENKKSTKQKREESMLLLMLSKIFIFYLFLYSFLSLFCYLILYSK